MTIAKYAGDDWIRFPARLLVRAEGGAWAQIGSGRRCGGGSRKQLEMRTLMVEGDDVGLRNFKEGCWKDLEWRASSVEISRLQDGLVVFTRSESDWRLHQFEIGDGGNSCYTLSFLHKQKNNNTQFSRSFSI
ncbi:hypothetical protein RYX36_002271 [Vicia faba]